MTMSRNLKRPAAARSGWILAAGAIIFLSVPSGVFSWLPTLPSVGNRIATTAAFSSTELFSSQGEYYDEGRRQEDFTGKTIYQRTFYRLSPDSQVRETFTFKKN